MNNLETIKKTKEILFHLLSLKNTNPLQRLTLSESEIIFLCEITKKTFLSEKTLLSLKAPYKLLGDIHGNFQNLLQIFKNEGNPEKTKYLLLGDYVDRGPQSLETICLLFCLKILNKNFYLIRGNHECSGTNRNYSFFKECTYFYNYKIWKLFNEVFDCLPLAAIINKKIFCVHGGLSPSLKKIEEIKKIQRPVKIGVNGLLTDLLWSDPVLDKKGWCNSKRGISYEFGEDVVNKFMENNKLQLIVRAHQFVKNGFFLGRNKKIVTLFSSVNYLGGDGKGGVMVISDKLKVSFRVYEPVEEVE